MIPDNYTVENLKLLLENPDLARRELGRFIFKFRYGSGADFIREDWDNLILLDACRYDAFAIENSLDGRLESRITKGSTSRGFINGNFAGRELHDTVYVTANPYVGLICEDVFHAVITLLDRWDPDLQTVKPEAVVKACKNAYDTYPDKRLIVHFMQPHEPYLGEAGAKIRSKIQKEAKSRGWNNSLRGDNSIENDTMNGIKELNTPKCGNINVSKQDIWEAYLKTLAIVLESVEELLEFIAGKTVISADHGELIGEKPPLYFREKYGHPGYTWTPELRKVPWFIIDSTYRRRIRSDPPERYDTVDEEKLGPKLRALGYK